MEGRRIRVWLFGLGVAVAVAACNGVATRGDETTVAIAGDDRAHVDGVTGSCPLSIDPLKEIEIVDSSVTDPAKNGGLSADATPGPWSIVGLAQELAPFLPGTTTPDTQGFLSRLTNTSGFELIGIANRVDLRDGTNAGEGRMLFGNPSFASTIIFEYELPLIPGDLDTPEKWAAEWHKLSALSFGPDFNAQLLALTNRFTRRVDGQPPAIHQIRMALFDKGWDMTELHRDATGYMTRATTRNTPDISLDRSHALTVWLQQNQVALAAPNAVETFVMPDTFTFDDGGSQQTVQFLGTLSRNGPPVAWLTESGQSIATAFGAGVATTFNTLTCGGCHSGAARGVSSDVFQVAPGSSLADGTDRLSLFMRDPSKPDDPANPPDELRRRAGDLQHLLCGGAQTQVTFIIDDADITQVGQDIAIVGNIADLGNWSFAAGGLRLDGRGFPTWAGTVTLPRNASFEFKAIEVQGTQTLRWENGDNRTVQLPNVDAVAIRGSFRR